MSAGLRGEARVRRVRRDEWGGEMECVWRLRAVVGQLANLLSAVEQAKCTLERLVGNRVWSIQETWPEHNRM